MITYEDEDEVREAFWESMPRTPQNRLYQDQNEGGKRQNAFPADIRMAFVDFVDHLQKSGQITDELADEVIL